MASPRWMLPLLILGTSAITLVPAAREFHDELFRGNPDNLVRKKRSLDAADTPEYYNDLHSFKYHGGDTDRKFDRDFDEDDEEIEFLPGDNGQLETVGEGLQGLNNKLLERALLDYLETLPEQEEPVASIFRERERSGSRKRGGVGDRMNLDNKDLAKLFVEELQDGSPYGPLVEMDDDEYITALQSLYDRYRAGRGNKVYETAGPMSWSELLDKGSLLRSQTKDGNDEFVARDDEQGILYLPAAERRNVNARFPIGRELGSYRRLNKRYPVAKRSPRPTQTKLKTTDPKVAQDLGALFGTQSTDSHNHTHKSDHDHDHDHEHEHEHSKQESDKNHEHKHEPNQNHEFDHEHGGANESKSEAPPKVTPSPKGQKENVTKTDASSKFVHVRKKSVDWSQYFGIDRRKKKATFTAGQGTQNQDDEWMLQRYYENMAENLKPKEDENERKDKLEEMDSKLKYIKDLIIEEAMRYAASEDEADLQKVKDKLMSRMAAAYSLQKMRKALSDLRNNVVAQKEAQRMQKEAQNNFTSNFRENSNPNLNSGIGSKTDEKRNGINNNLEEGESMEEPRNCPELEAIEWRCRTVDNMAGDSSRMLYVPCVKLQICKACAQDEEGLLPCLANYALEAGKVCDALESRESGQRMTTTFRENERQSCANAALLLSQLHPPAVATAQCRARNARDSCLRRYHTRYEHRFRTSPAYEGTGRRVHHEGALDALQQTMSER
ncbi:uncharacterized protein LOC105202364 [Solenopsis invicta]|uniref:uncharacterized protein LOC105202364 n=1 Tax=Solenopsis invicta TaxID=13686 RepID=UPI0005958F87|nr:uncharacterized protein LOC105202364 [Solenopsis invicta]XP_039312701.1 uncharacterized protein LOC105202364 [Solenopsis invicta]